LRARKPKKGGGGEGGGEEEGKRGQQNGRTGRKERVGGERRGDEREKERQTDRQTGRQADRQAGRQTDGQTQQTRWLGRVRRTRVRRTKYGTIECASTRYGVATVSRIDKSIFLFCRILSLLQGPFAKETYDFIDPTNRSHPILDGNISSCNCYGNLDRKQCVDQFES